MSKKKKLHTTSNVGAYKKVIRSYCNQENRNDKTNSQYDIPQYVVDLCNELCKLTRKPLGDILLAEMKASITQDYAKALAEYCNE